MLSDKPLQGQRSRGLVVAVVVACRPRQWAKNLLVFGAPLTGGVLTAPASLGRALVAFAALCLVSSGLYLVNDLLDRAEDLAHPLKRNRPIAAGEVSARVATTVAAMLLVAGLLVAAAGSGLELTVVVGGYAALVLTYTLWWRAIAVLDLAAIAGGFLLRAVAGGVAVDIPLSTWFLIVASFGSLFIAAGKRHAEFVGEGLRDRVHRVTLDRYSEHYLRFVQYSSVTVAITAYCLWAFEGASGTHLWSGLSIIPFVLAVFRYALLLEEGHGGTPEDLILRDKPLLGLGLLWVATVAAGVYVAP